MLQWLAEELPGVMLRDVAKAMNDHVQEGGVIDQVRESRPEWSVWPFHYDFRLRIAGRTVYIETILQDEDPSDSTIHIVSIHDA